MLQSNFLNTSREAATNGFHYNLVLLFIPLSQIKLRYTNISEEHKQTIFFFYGWDANGTARAHNGQAAAGRRKLASIKSQAPFMSFNLCNIPH